MKNKMFEISQISHIVELLKDYAVFIFAVLLGAVAHALEKIKSSGWKGFFYLSSDVVVCSFVGFLFYHFAMGFYPDGAIVACSIGSFWGTKGFNFIRDIVINAVKANIK